MGISVTWSRIGSNSVSTPLNSLPRENATPGEKVLWYSLSSEPPEDDTHVGGGRGSSKLYLPYSVLWFPSQSIVTVVVRYVGTQWPAIWL